MVLWSAVYSQHRAGSGYACASNQVRYKSLSRPSLASLARWLTPLMRQLVCLRLFVDFFHGVAEAVVFWIGRPDGEVAGCEAVGDAMHGLEAVLKFKQRAKG